jgi:hypothetical protein
MNFLVMNDIDVHKLNLRPYTSFQFLVENSFKFVFLHFLSNKCIINTYSWGKNLYFKKKEKIL